MDNSKIDYIDVTPTWRGLVPAFVALIENGDAEGRAHAIKELYRMADAVDAINAERKAANA